jgi:hypothetical protein
VGALAACLLVTLIAVLGLALLAAAYATAAHERQAGEDDGGGGGGGSVRRTPLGRPPEPPGAEPEWWPAFERDLSAYVRERAGTAG